MELDLPDVFAARFIYTNNGKQCWIKQRHTHTRVRSFIRVNEKKIRNFTKLSFIVCLKCWTFVIKLKSAGVHRVFFPRWKKKSNKKIKFWGNKRQKRWVKIKPIQLEVGYKCEREQQTLQKMVDSLCTKIMCS